jgi:hypothetical protein
VSGDYIFLKEGKGENGHVRLGFDTEFLGDFEECFNGWDNVENGNVGACFSESFCECETASSSSACY